MPISVAEISKKAGFNRTSPPPTLKVSIIIPVWNEEKILPSSIRYLRETATKGPVEIIVVDGKSQDQTFSVANAVADKTVSSSYRSRSYQMHQGAQVATGDILLFLHVDTLLPKNWQFLLLTTWGSSQKPAVTAFRAGFDKKTRFYQTLAHMAHWRTKWLTGVPHGDQGLAVERKIYLQSGGFPSVPLMEEYYLMRQLKPFGKLKIFKDPVSTSTRRYEKNGPLYNNLRNLTLLFLFYLGVSPKFLAKLYR